MIERSLVLIKPDAMERGLVGRNHQAYRRRRADAYRYKNAAHGYSACGKALRPSQG